jgi:hypothetical protein
LIEDRAGRFRFGATRDEQHDPGLGSVLYGAGGSARDKPVRSIACAESWEDIALYGRSKQAWLATFLALPNGIPSHDTFRRVFMLIDPDAFEACFTRWVQSWARGVEREVVAVDGKTVRRSGSRRYDHGPLHVVSAWASEQGLALGQRAVNGVG